MNVSELKDASTSNGKPEYFSPTEKKKLKKRRIGFFYGCRIINSY